MGIQRQDTLIHWNYFLAIEEELEKISKYVDFSGNDDVYSIEIAKLFLSACSEVDVILKQLCKSLNPQSSASSINAYFAEISNKINRFNNFEVTIPRLGLTLHPWEDWTDNNPPFWWQHHNKVKHHRHEHFEKANLKNCLNSVAGLYIAVLYLYQQHAGNGELLQLPKLLNVGDAYFGGVGMGRNGHYFNYKLW